MNNNEWKRVCAACAEGTPPERCAYYGDPNGCNAPTLGAHPEGDLAERLQEALEKAERRIAELERAPGNAAAMREALEQALAYCESDQRSGIAYSDNDVLVPILRAALSAPARNCDRFKTAVGAMEEWGKYPQSRYKGCRLCPHGGASMVSPAHLTLAEWLFVPSAQ